MNLRGGWALIQSSWLSWMQYRSFFFILAFGWMVPPLVALLAWSAAAGDGQAGGLNRDDFAAYYLVLMFVNQFTYAQANWTLGDVIRAGSLSSWLLRPMPAIFHVLAAEAAGKTVTLVFVAPVTALLALFFHPQVDINPENVLLFGIALLLAWGLRFLWGYWLALLAFWTSRADALLALQDALVFLLSGVVAPVALLPGSMQAFAQALPFRYMIGFPVEILTGGLNGDALLTGFATQLAWLALAGLLSIVLWQIGIRRYSAIGG